MSVCCFHAGVKTEGGIAITASTSMGVCEFDAEFEEELAGSGCCFCFLFGGWSATGA